MIAVITVDTSERLQCRREPHDYHANTEIDNFSIDILPDEVRLSLIQALNFKLNPSGTRYLINLVLTSQSEFRKNVGGKFSL
jgi:hypothetical protein